MGLKVAVANGNWSNPATWNAGVLPNPGDVVASNNFTVTIDQNINVDLLTNTVTNPTTSVPTMTGYTTPFGIVTASSEYTAANGEPWKAFDNNTGTAWLSANNSGPAGWLGYEFSTSRIITGYTISNPNTPTAFPRNWTFEAWDGTSWIVLHTVTGNTNTFTYSGSFTNTISYIKYRINITANNGLPTYISIGEFKIYVAGDSLVASVAGGGFVLSGTYTITTTGQGLVTGATRLLTYTGSNSIINGNIIGSTTTNVQTIYHDSTGALTINGDVVNTVTTFVEVIVTNSTGTLNINGNIQGNGRGINVYVLSVCTVNIIGNVTRGSNFSGGAALQINAGATVNVTGTLSNNAGGTGSPTVVINSSVCILNVTGDILFNGAQINCNTITISQPGRVNVIGNLNNTGTGSVAISSSTNSYLSIIGSIYTTVNTVSVSSTNGNAINLFSGPFICTTYGFFPYQVVRMHLIPTTSSYFEFRDETTNGAVSPGAIAPATRMIAPAGVSDSPIPANVRFGITYANGSLAGTLRIPNANSVAFGVEVDNTIGNAVITPQSVWDFAVANLTTMGSIGERLKKTSTVDSTGAQLSSFEF